MKRITQIFALLFSITLLFSSCDEGLNCIDPDQDRVTEVFELPEFTGVKLAMAGNVFITQGEEQEVKITGSQNILDKLDLDIRSNTLVLDINRCILGDDDLLFEITIPVVEELLISGSGNMETTNTLDESDLYLSISGAGNMDILFDEEKVEARISGSGNMHIAGATNRAEYKISGSGTLRSYDLSSENSEVNISGSGNINVTVSEKLTGKISGSGNVSYKGDPEEIDVKVTGSGRLIDAN